MAYNFNGSNQYLSAAYSTNSLTGTWPVTIFCRARSSNLTLTQIPATWVYANSPYNGLYLVMNGALAGDPIQFNQFGGKYIASALSYASGDWFAFAGRVTSNTVFDINADDTVDVGPTTSIAWANASKMVVGGRLTPTFANPHDGDVATVAMWDAVLDNAEMHSLRVGFSPRRVRPQNLKFYAPLVRELVVIQAAAQPTVAWANTNAAAVAAHPRSYGF